jgi:hypothetical protein
MEVRRSSTSSISLTNSQRLKPVELATAYGTMDGTGSFAFHDHGLASAQSVNPYMPAICLS